MFISENFILNLIDTTLYISLEEWTGGQIGWQVYHCKVFYLSYLYIFSRFKLTHIYLFILDLNCKLRPLVTLITHKMSDQTNAVNVSIETKDQSNFTFLLFFFQIRHLCMSYFLHFNMFCPSSPLPLISCFVQLGKTLTFFRPPDE